MWKPFCDKNPAVDEYIGSSVGIVIGWRMLFGLYKAEYQQAYGLIIFNQAAGIWFDKESQFGTFFDSFTLLPVLLYVCKIMILVMLYLGLKYV